jgi:hypothetical protein
MKITGFECCFCKKDIIENDVDPCDLNIILNSEMKKLANDRSSLNLYSHFDCLKEKLDKNMQGYLLAISPYN